MTNDPEPRWVDGSRLSAETLAERFSGARPFPHVVVDDVVPARARTSLCEALDDEPSERIVDDIYEVNATDEPLTQPVLARFVDRFDATVRPLAEALVGGSLSRLTMRGFAFSRGHFLLPHADSDRDHSRRLAFIVYLLAADLEGGDLELFDVDSDGEEIVATIPAGRIAPVPGRLVLLEVAPRSLHQVREVTAGIRASLSGWFYA